MRRLLAAAAALAFLGPAARADDAPRPRADPSAPDVQDVVFHGKSRPVFATVPTRNSENPSKRGPLP